MWPRAHSSTTAACSARTSVPRTLLEDVDELLRNADAHLPTSTRWSWAPVRKFYEHADRPRGRAGSRARARAAGRRRLDPAGACECEGRRLPGRRRSPPRGLARPARARAGRPRAGAGTTVVGSGAVRYRATLEDKGVHVPRRRRDPPPPRALACGSRERVPARRGGRALYVRSPDAKVRAPREPRAATTRAARSRHGRGHRARVVSDPVVTLDVRR